MSYFPGGTLTNPEPVVLRDTDLNLSPGVTSYKDLLMTQRYTLLSDSVADGTAPWWVTTFANGGTFTATAGEGLSQTSANAAGAAHNTSPNVPYLPGHTAWLMAAFRFGDLGSAGNIRRIGSYTLSGTTPQDGFAFELDGTALEFVIYKGGTATTIAQASWTHNTTSPFTLSLNYHLLTVHWTANQVDFYLDRVLRHQHSGGSTSITNSLSLPLSFQNINTSGATNRVLAVRNIGLGRYGIQEGPTEPPTTTASVSIDRSGSITTGGTAQTIAINNPLRRGLSFQNTSSADMRVTENGSAATATTGYLINAGGTASINTKNSISVFGATTGQTFAATEY